MVSVAAAQTETFPEAHSPAIQNSDVNKISDGSRFDSIISSGYRPRASDSLLELNYFNYNYTMGLTASSTTISGSVKFADIKSTASYVEANYIYALSDKSNIKISVENTFNKGSSYNYTADAKSVGYSDYSTSKKGFAESVLTVDRLFKNADDLRIVGAVNLSPGLGSASDTNSLRGGSAIGFGFDLYKSNGKIEFNTGVSYWSYMAQAYDDGKSSNETTGGNLLTVKVGANVFIESNASFGIEIGRKQYDSSTTKYKNNTTPYETAGYGSTSYLIGYKNALSKDLAFQIGYYGESIDSSVLKVSTTKITSDQTTATGFGLGLKIGF